MHIILESKMYQVNSKLTNYNIYYTNGDQTIYQYIALIKKIFDIQYGFQVSLLGGYCCSKITSFNIMFIYIIFICLFYSIQLQV